VCHRAAKPGTTQPSQGDLLSSGSGPDFFFGDTNPTEYPSSNYILVMNAPIKEQYLKKVP
jgi:hypothetical protein